MILSETLFILLIIGTVFLSGAAVGQLVLRVKLARLEKTNLELEQRRVAELKKVIQARSIVMEKRPPTRFEQSVRDEIDDMLGESDNF